MVANGSPGSVISPTATGGQHQDEDLANVVLLFLLYII